MAETNEFELTSSSDDSIADVDDFSLTAGSGRKKKTKQKSDEFSAGEIVHEKNFKGNDYSIFEKHGDGDKKDTPIRTSYHISPYAYNLLGGLKDNNKSSFALSGLHVVSSVIDEFELLMANQYTNILKIRSFMNDLNSIDTEIDLSIPCSEIYGGEKKKHKVTVMILSSSQTVIKKHSESFMIRDSDIFELLIYLYFTKSTHESNLDIKRAELCKDRILMFTDKINKLIEDQTAFTNQDTAEIMFLKCQIRNVYKTSMKRYLPDGDEFTLIIQRKRSTSEKKL